MESPKPVIVIDSAGRQGIVEADSMLSRQNGAQLIVRFEGMQPMAVPLDMLILRTDGQYELPLNVADLTASPSPEAMKQTTVIPLMAEEVLVSKRQVETGRVQVKKIVHETQELVDVPLLREKVEITRVPLNRPVDSPVPVRYDGDTMIISVLEEVLVIQKQLLLKEEIHITSKRLAYHQPEQVTLRREELLVEPVETASTEAQP